MIVAGVGFRRGVEVEEIVLLVTRALAAAAIGRDTLSGLATVGDKADEPGFRLAAERLGVAPLSVSRDALLRAAPADGTMSPRSMTMYGVNSLAEAAALAGAGPSSILVLARLASAGATCALARGRGA
jgi:cobalt-precorrin 5A hydrolase